MNDASVVAYLTNLQKCFASGTTRSYDFRKQQLEKLKAALYRFEEDIYAALYSDLKKNKEECWVTEIGFTIAEINNALRNLRKWMQPQSKATNLLNWPSKSFVMKEPLGTVLIIGPWNYPLQLVLAPLVGAIAAGNTVVVKPSEYAPATAGLLQKIISSVFPPEYVWLVQGEGAAVIPQMMNHFRFDHIFYTGSTQVGKMIYQMASKQLTPVTLELGGKSPCIIEADANIKVAAKRIALTKFSNAGQMCVAPDYLLLHEKIKTAFLAELVHQIKSFYENDDYHYGRLVNEKSFQRLKIFLEQGHILYGGKIDEATLYIQPTIIELSSTEMPVMEEEIFGPLLPVLTWRDEEEVYRIIEKNKDPLALYVFTENTEKAKKWLNTIAFGGGCINNASWHLTNHHLPFGGRGNSGMGRYHGRYSFATFSHEKAIMNSPTWFDPSIKYPPFKGKLNWFKRFIR